MSLFSKYKPESLKCIAKISGHSHALFEQMFMLPIGFRTRCQPAETHYNSRKEFFCVIYRDVFKNCREVGKKFL
jgi:hypothetical protein